MTQEIKILLEIRAKGLVKEITEGLEEMIDVRVFEGPHADNPESQSIKESIVPDIVMLYDNQEPSDIFEKLIKIRQKNKQASVFVISTNHRPEHIIEVMKAGAGEIFFKPLNLHKIKEATERVREKIGNAVKLVRGSLFSFVSSKGGLGSTVIAVNTATALSMRGNGSVALMDMSLQSGDASALLDVVPETTIFDLCKNYHRLDFSLLRGAMTRHPTGINFLPAPTAPEESSNIQADHVREVFNLSKSLFGTVIVDCPSMSINDCSLEVFKASDNIFVLTDLSVPAVRNASRLIKHMVGKGIALQKIEIVVNRYIKEKALSLDQVEKNLGKKVFWLFPNDFDSAISSINYGAPFVQSSPKTKISKNVIDFSGKLLNPTQNKKKRGLKNLFGLST